MAQSSGDTEQVEIDDSLYSRMRYMYGDKAMTMMQKSSVFLSGLGGLGVESAKNVALAGVRRLTLHDTKSATLLDLSSQFYLKQEDIGKNRAELSHPHIDTLNPYCVTDTSSVDLASEEDLSFLRQYTVVVMTDAHLDTQLRISDYCHENGIHFISAASRGLFGWVFADMGENFSIFDPSGESTVSVLIADISRTCPAEVTALLLEKKTHGLQDGDHVRISNVAGLEELNGQLYRVKVKSAETFTLWLADGEDTWTPLDTSKAPEPFRKGSGEAVEERQGASMNFLSLREALVSPEFLMTDTAKWGHSATAHVGMQALAAFERRHGTLPAPWSWSHANEVVEEAKQLGRGEELDESLLRRMAFTAQGNLCPVAAFLGGVVAQEVLKGVSGKFTPLHQWVYYDAVELLPANAADEGFDASDYVPAGDRYDGQVICIGKEASVKLAEAKLFMVGSGAIGCEMLKNYAMMGVASSSKGRIILTDNDLIEKSNLNRQFLFRPENIQEPKATAAANAAKAMNPALHVNPHLDRVGPKTEGTYSDRFFSAMDVVVNALDNVEARMYVDQRCVANQKPLLESGTLGPKGHVEAYLPFKTMSYSSSRDPPEGDVPFCTLKTFPAKIDHCIQWARDLVFEGQFASKAMEYNRMIGQSDLLARLESNDADLSRSFRSVARFVRKKPASFSDCVAYARQKYEQFFVNSAKTLLNKFPLDHTNEDGSPFWQNPKRPPRPLAFDATDELHVQFVRDGALLWAAVWGIEQVETDLAVIGKLASGVKVKEFVLKDKNIETDEKAKPTESAVSADELEGYRVTLVDYFSRAQQPLTEVMPAEFEKDDQSNHHIDFITAAANLRARVYGLAETTSLECKRIAGRIVPATATTTSCVSGLAALELIKVMMDLPMEKFIYWFMNLGIPLFAAMEPTPVQETQLTKSLTATMWDRWEVKKGVSTLQDLVEHFKEKKGLEVMGVCQKDGKMIYMSVLPMYKSKLGMKMRTLLSQQDGEKYRDLVVTFRDEDGEQVKNAPVVRYYFRRSKKT